MSSDSFQVIPPALAERPLLGDIEVEGLSRLFSILANDTRLRILHVIARSGEAAVSDIAEAADASVQGVSNHLQRLADLQIVATRRDGNRVFYRLVDPCIGGVMELGLCLLGHNPTCDTWGWLSHLHRLVCRGAESFEARYIDHFANLPHVQKLTSQLAIKSIKRTKALPVHS